MSPFYNRDPWNLVIALGTITVLLVLVSAATSWWLLLAPIAIAAAVHSLAQVRRLHALITLGYHSRAIRHARLVYEERSPTWTRSLVFKLENTEPGHYELFVPKEPEWVRSVPDWATKRRVEIAQRIANTWRRDDVHFSQNTLDA